MRRLRRSVLGAAVPMQAPLDEAALCQALRISPSNARTREFLTLIEHDLRYLTDRTYRANFDNRIGGGSRAGAGSRKQRGRPRDEIARSLVALFRSRVESVLKLDLGLSKRGGSLYNALSIYLAAADRGRPDRHISWIAPWRSHAEKAALRLRLTTYSEDLEKDRRAGLKVLDKINKALTKKRNR